MKPESYILQNLTAEYILTYFNLENLSLKQSEIWHDLHHDFVPPGLNIAIVINVKRGCPGM